jgi:hypothetical protein
MPAKRRKKVTKKETKIAKKLVQPRWPSCTDQSCGSVHACAALCESMHCGDLNCGTLKRVAAKKRGKAAPRGGPFCPAEIICSPLKCDKVSR